MVARVEGATITLGGIVITLGGDIVTLGSYQDNSEFILPANDFVEIDYLSEARERYTVQFNEKSVFDRYVELLLSEFIELQQVFKSLMQLRSIDTATGVQLDIIGNIVGQPRIAADGLIYNFGYDNVAGTGATDILSFGSVNDPQVGGFYRSFYDPLTGVTTLNDDEYRTLIKVKIIKNTAKGTTDEIIRAAGILFNEPNIIVNHDSEGYLEIDINRPWDDLNYTLFPGIQEKSLALKYLPVPLGVRLGFGS